MSFQNGPDEWKMKSTKKVYDNYDLSVYEDTIDLGGQKKVYVRGVRRDYSTVVSFISDNEILLIKRYRHLVDSIQIEVPLDYIEEGESAEQTANRILEKKIGYVAKDLIPLGSYRLDYTMLEQTGHIFAAYGLMKVQKPKQKQESMESIELIAMSIKDVRRHLLDGKISDASSTVALYRALDYHDKTHG